MIRPWICVTLVGVVVLVAGGTARAAYTWHSYNGHAYTLTENWLWWDDAQTEAVAAGGHLVTINDAAENNWLSQTFNNAYTRDHAGDGYHNIAWIGYHHDGGSWRWVSGEPVTFTSYYSLWPEGGEHAYIHCDNHPSPATWNAHDFHESPGAYPQGIIEVIPEPATAAMLAIGGLMVGQRRH